ncbi:MAG TPA: cupin domain-containing protein [Casimicrobiaceae bacterium]|nr:cupin domain-containing protein [Casimicrobiaceae bacterium]
MDRRLLGGNTVRAFLARHWQKEALLVREACPGLTPVLSRDELFALARRDDVRSRLVRRVRGRYTQDDGPFSRAALARLPARNWTLLVHDVNLVNDRADALLRQFSFIPYARLDDLMVSFAAPGGGVGPHYDSYDVFLLQALGRRRWRYGKQHDLRLVRGAPLRILAHFAPAHDATLAPGDMLYLPPDVTHDGAAIDHCMTYSIGFRAPAYQELGEAFLDHLRDALALPGRYADPDRRESDSPALIDSAMERRVTWALSKIRWNRADVARFLGCYLTEPKYGVVFDPPPRTTRVQFRRRVAREGVRLDRRTQLLYDDARLYINGDDAPMPDSGVDALRTLANTRALAASACATLPADALDLLYDWHRHGFLARP